MHMSKIITDPLDTGQSLLECAAAILQTFQKFCVFCDNHRCVIDSVTQLREIRLKFS